MLKISILVLAALLLLAPAARSYSDDLELEVDEDEEFTEDLDNGCTITRYVNNHTDSLFESHFFKPWLPHLNCSGGSSSGDHFEVEGVVEDVRSITLSNKQLTSFYVDDLAPFPLLKRLELRSNQLIRIVPSARRIVFNDVTMIFLNDNRLTRVPNEALQSFPNVTILSLSNNRITEMSREDFRYNRNLQFLTMGYNPFVQPLDSSWLTDLELSYLVIKSSGLTSIPEELSTQKEMVAVDLSDNLIRSVQEDQFSGCSMLHWIGLTANKITSVHHNAFRGASKLSSIELSDNLITWLEEGVFDHVTLDELKIELYENPIACDCRMSWLKRWHDDLTARDTAAELRYKCYQPARLHGIKPQSLTLEDFTCRGNEPLYQACNQTTLPASKKKKKPSGPPEDLPCPSKCSCYDHNGQLYSGPDITKKQTWTPWDRPAYPRVDCVDAGHTSIPHQKMPVDVRQIVMMNNAIVRLEISDLRRLTSLKSLSLKNNKIEEIVAADDDVELPELTTLSVQFNYIRSITSDHLRAFPNLEILACYHNRITKLPSDLFHHNKKMKRMYLGPNPIRYFDDSFLRGSDLKSLSLRNLSLTRIPDAVVKMVNLSYLDVSDNRITLIKNGTFSNHHKLWRMDMENNKIMRIEANAFNGAIKLRSLLLSENKLKTLDAGVFSNLSSESLNVELWENPIECNCSMRGFHRWVEQKNEIDPTTDIEFRCFAPTRMSGLVSDRLEPEDFVCLAGDHVEATSAPGGSIGGTPVCECPQTGGGGGVGGITIAVISTFVLTVALCALLWKMCFRAKYGHLLRYARQRSGSAYEDGGILPDEEF